MLPGSSIRGTAWPPLPRSSTCIFLLPFPKEKGFRPGSCQEKNPRCLLNARPPQGSKLPKTQPSLGTGRQPCLLGWITRGPSRWRTSLSIPRKIQIITQETLPRCRMQFFLLGTRAEPSRYIFLSFLLLPSSFFFPFCMRFGSHDRGTRRRGGRSPSAGQAPSTALGKYKPGYFVQQTLVSRSSRCLQGDSFWVIERRTAWNKFNKTR